MAAQFGQSGSPPNNSQGPNGSQKDDFYKNMPPIFPEDSQEDTDFPPFVPPSKVPEPEKKEEIHPTKITEGEVVSSQEVKEAASPESSEESLLEEDLGELKDSSFAQFREKFSTLLQDAHIGPRQIGIYCGGCLILVLLIFGAVWGIQKWFLAETPEPAEIVQDIPSEPVISPEQKEDPALSTAQFLGLEPGSILQWKDVSLQSAFLLGTESERFEQRFTQHIQFLKKVKNALQTDLFQYLSQSRDRSRSLDDYVRDLEKMLEEGSRNTREIESIMELLQTQFENDTAAKNDYEQRFFAALDSLSGDEAQEFLEKFVEIKKSQVELQAQFQAYKRLKEGTGAKNQKGSFYDKFLRIIARRLKDIDLNRDALIKGVKVVELEGSDLDLVVSPE